MVTVSIRPAEPEEAPAIWRLTLDAFGAQRLMLDPPSGVFRETVDDVLRAMANGAVYTALQDGLLVGAVRVRAMEEERALYCGRLAVAPGVQRSGIGTALIARVERQAVDERRPAVVVGVRMQLPGNLRFFTGLGYRVFAERSHPGYAQPTYLMLRKELGCGEAEPAP